MDSTSLKMINIVFTILVISFFLILMLLCLPWLTDINLIVFTVINNKTVQYCLWNKKKCYPGTFNYVWLCTGKNTLLFLFLNNWVNYTLYIIETTIFRIFTELNLFRKQMCPLNNIVHYGVGDNLHTIYGKNHTSLLLSMSSLIT